MKCTQYICQHHTVIGCGRSSCYYFNGAELRVIDVPIIEIAKTNDDDSWDYFSLP